MPLYVNRENANDQVSLQVSISEPSLLYFDYFFHKLWAAMLIMLAGSRLGWKQHNLYYITNSGLVLHFRFSLRCRCCHSLVAERRAQPWLHNPFKDHWWICSSLFIFWVMFIFYHSRILGLRVSWVWAFIMELHNYPSSEVEILVMWSWK